MIRSARSRSWWIVALLCGVLISGCLSLAIGARSIDVRTFFDMLGPAIEALRTGSTGASDAEIIANLRLPRTLLALTIGAALGVAGAIVQGQTRNPLAEPGILGISAGAAFAITVGSVVGAAVTTPMAIVLAFGGACLASLCVFTVTSVGGGPKPLTLILAGAAMAALLSSLTSALVLSDAQSMDRLRFWTIGSVAGATLEVAVIVAPLLLAGVGIGFATAPTLNLLALGDDVAASLGVNVAAARTFAIALVAFLAGATTAAAGPIGFVGLVVPHLVRSITGPDYRWMLPVSALGGAILLTLADVVGRIAVPQGEVEVGVVLAFIGAPFFIAIVRRRQLVAV